MKIQDLAQKAFKANSEKGFWDEDRDVLEGLSLINSELSEALEAKRKGKQADLSMINEEDFVNTFKEYGKDTFEDELADSLIRMADFYGGMNFSENQLMVSDSKEYEEIVEPSKEYINLSNKVGKSLFFIQKMICAVDGELNDFIVNQEDFQKEIEKIDITDSKQIVVFMEKFQYCSYFNKLNIACPSSLVMAFDCLYSYAVSKNIDIDKHIELKMRYNATREYKHGKKF